MSEIRKYRFRMEALTIDDTCGFFKDVSADDVITDDELTDMVSELMFELDCNADDAWDYMMERVMEI